MSEKIYMKKYEKIAEKYRYPVLEKAIKMGKEKCMEELELSRLRGRGGAGFSTYKKWNFVEGKEDVVLICNGDEGEPGTFKDRYIMENITQLFLEGVLISAFILDAKEIYIYIRGEYTKAILEVESTLASLKDISHAKEIASKVVLVKGAGAYVCGDETSLINSIEGKRGNSRIKPPYPVNQGLFGKPTVVNNIETLSNIPLIIQDGGQSYSTLGDEDFSGTKLISLSGNINKSGVYEVEYGKINFEQIVNQLGQGMKNGKDIKFVIPGGISTKILTREEINCRYSYKDLAKYNSSFGSGAIIVGDEEVNILDLLTNVADFFMHETCGICFPCREGNRQISHLLKNIDVGEFKAKNMQLIKEIGRTTKKAARCGLGQVSADLIESIFDKFYDEI